MRLHKAVFSLNNVVTSNSKIKIPPCEKLSSPLHQTSDARAVHAAEIGRIEEQIRQLQEFCEANDVPILEEEEQGEGDEETGEDKAEDDGAGGADAEKEV